MKVIHQIVVLLLATLATSVAAQYPLKPVRIINPYAAGGTGDIITRAVVQRITETTGKSFVIDNRTGAGGRIGYEAGVNAAPDGYTLVLTDTTFTLLPLLFRTLAWDGIDALTPITILAETPFAIVARPGLNTTSLKDLIALAKSRPGALNYGSSGGGTINHIAAELFQREAGVEITHIPYKGMADAITGMLGGSVDLLVMGVFIAAPHAKAGKMVPLAVAGPRRSQALPDVPTAAEAGLPQFRAGNWFGWTAPKGTPKEAVAWMHQEVVNALGSPAIKSLLAAQGADASGIAPEQLGEVMRGDRERWAEVIRAARIRLD